MTNYIFNLRISYIFLKYNYHKYSVFSLMKFLLSCSDRKVQIIFLRRNSTGIPGAVCTIRIIGQVEINSVNIITIRIYIKINVSANTVSLTAGGFIGEPDTV